MIPAPTRWPDTVFGGTTFVMLGAFGLSVVLHALDTRLLADGKLMLCVASAFLAACVIEMGYITLQAAMGQPSHFNTSTPLHEAVFSAMALLRSHDHRHGGDDWRGRVARYRVSGY